MLGAAINVLPFMIQRSVPGIGPHVLSAYVFAAVPAILAALAYAILASSMPRAGGSYIYASRGLNPYLGFVASFSQWFGVSVAIGVVSYVLIPFLRDIVSAMGIDALAMALDTGVVRVSLALVFLWSSVGINLLGLRVYERILVPMMFVMFVFGSIVIVTGFLFDHGDFAAGLAVREGLSVPPEPARPFSWASFLAASALLFSSFIGFDSIAQAGGEAKNPGRSLPLAIGIAVVSVGTFYLLFTAAVYHTVPWSFVAEKALTQDLTAPGLLGYVLSPGWTILIVAGAAVALINDLPAMLLSVSRLVFAWAEDGVFPKSVARIHQTRHTPHIALVLSGLMASLSIFGSHFAGDFFLGVDILVTSMLLNFIVMCAAVLALPHRNPRIAKDVTVLRSRRLQIPVAVAGIMLLGTFLVVHLWKDMTADVSAWYLHSTPLWVVVMALATCIYVWELRKLKRDGVDTVALFQTLPPE
ncbi:MAG TPA: amino acid transporter [Gemmatimonadetes bacterium]|jgi:APA family basic amino acid/polyamine antiporter|nr:amino acid transporter [Gemmatimonadota bacterium]|tara:strand:- start:16359 stop:17771 length:1413 start_codon:yes stop_codon:yes gene_type:complete